MAATYEKDSQNSGSSGSELRSEPTGPSALKQSLAGQSLADQQLMLKPSVQTKGAGGGEPVVKAKPITVTVTGNNVQINASMELHGAGATAAVGTRFQSGINSMWSGTFGKYTVVTNCSVSVRSGAKDDKSKLSVDVKKVAPDAKSPTSTAQLGGRKGWWDDKDTGNVAAHEFGHFLGLDDEYHYEVQADGTKKFVNDNPGSIMAETWGTPKPDAAHIEKIIKRFVNGGAAGGGGAKEPAHDHSHDHDHDEPREG